MTASLSPDADARLPDAIEAVYRAFAAPAPPVIHGCPCCIDTRGVDVLLTTPLRALSGQAVWGYVSGVFLTIGDDRDFEYLLPRIFEIAVTDPGESNSPEIVLGKLRRARWQAWTPARREAVEALVDIWFEQALARDLAEAADGWIGWEADSVLCGIACAGLPLTRWLARLREPDTAPVLADLKQRFPKRLSAFWKDAPDGLAALGEMLDQAAGSTSR